MKAANALVSSQLDYCNSLFRSLSAFNLRKLQIVQDSLARIVTNTTRYPYKTPVLNSLHWLPVQERLVFKTATIVHKFLQSCYSYYFRAFLNPRKFFTTLLVARWRVKFLRCHSLFHPFIRQLSDLALIMPMMLPRYGVSCRMTSTLPHLFYFFFRRN